MELPTLRKPLLEKVSHQPEEAEEPMAAMAQYYLTRFSNDTNSSEEERRELAWPHLVRAADLGRQDAEALDLLGKIVFFVYMFWSWKCTICWGEMMDLVCYCGLESPLIIVKALLFIPSINVSSSPAWV